MRLQGARQGLAPEGLRNPVGLRHQEIGHGDGEQAGACLSGPEAAGCGPADSVVGATVAPLARV